jgi:hypothetical protein
MTAPKLKPSQLGSLYLHDKKSVESLVKRLNEMIQKDPGMGKKAALVIESWLTKKTKP